MINSDGKRLIGFKKYWQVLWWWDYPTFRYYEYPQVWKDHLSEPVFRGWDFGIFEIRYFNKMPIWS